MTKFRCQHIHLVGVSAMVANTCIVVGDDEMKARQVNVRYRDDTSSQDRGKPVPLQEAIEKLVALRDSKKSENPFPHEAKPVEAAQKA